MIYTLAVPVLAAALYWQLSFYLQPEPWPPFLLLLLLPLALLLICFFKSRAQARQEQARLSLCDKVTPAALDRATRARTREAVQALSRSEAFKSFKGGKLKPGRVDDQVLRELAALEQVLFDDL